MKLNFILILIIGICFIVSGPVILIHAQENGPSEEESRLIALDFILNSPTFTGREGKEDSIRLLSVAVLESPFSWQFNYEFQCEVPGYGSSTGPAPKVTTSYTAEIVVQEGAVIKAVLNDEWDMIRQSMIDGSTSLEGNQVSINFSSECKLTIWEDNFTNGTVIGTMVWRIPDIVNTTDETGQPIKGLSVTLDSARTFDFILSGGDLVEKGPPVYEWFFGDIAEEHEHTGWATDVLVGFDRLDSPGAVPFTFTPGYDISRSFDRTIFTTEDTQTVTVTVVPRDERIKGIEIFVNSPKSELLDAVIVSHSGWGGYQAYIDADRLHSGVGAPGQGIPVELNTPVSISVTFQVTPRVPIVECKPHVSLALTYSAGNDSLTTISGTAHGDSFTVENEAGIWTVSAEGDYFWNWAVCSSPAYGINLGPVSSIPVTSSSKTNQVVYWSAIAGVVIAGSILFLIIRRQRRRKAR